MSGADAGAAEGYVWLPVAAFRPAFEGARAAAREAARSDPWAAHDPAWGDLAAWIAAWEAGGHELWPTDEFISVPEGVSAALQPWMPRRR